MKKLILVIDGVESTRYKYNLWEAHQYEDGALSEDHRVVHRDDLDIFLKELTEYIRSVDAKETISCTGNG